MNETPTSKPVAGDVAPPQTGPVPEPAAPAGSGQRPEPSYVEGDKTSPAGEDANTQLLTDVRAVKEMIEQRLRYDVTKEEAFQNLYEDLERFRGESQFLQSRGLYMDLLLLLDRLDNSLTALGDRSEETVSLLQSVHDEVSEILARRGVQPLAGAETFDATIQRVVATESTNQPSQHNAVARIVRRGYECDGRTLRPEEVVVYRYSERSGVEG